MSIKSLEFGTTLGATDQTIYLFVDTVKAGAAEADYNVLPSLN